jgi:hypothetical protein
MVFRVSAFAHGNELGIFTGTAVAADQQAFQVRQVTQRGPPYCGARASSSCAMRARATAACDPHHDARALPRLPELFVRERQRRLALKLFTSIRRCLNRDLDTPLAIEDGKTVRIVALMHAFAYRVDRSTRSVRPMRRDSSG